MSTNSQTDNASFPWSECGPHPDQTCLWTAFCSTGEEDKGFHLWKSVYKVTTGEPHWRRNLIHVIGTVQKGRRLWNAHKNNQFKYLPGSEGMMLLYDFHARWDVVLWCALTWASLRCFWLPQLYLSKWGTRSVFLNSNKAMWVFLCLFHLEGCRWLGCSHLSLSFLHFFLSSQHWKGSLPILLSGRNFCLMLRCIFLLLIRDIILMQEKDAGNQVYFSNTQKIFR